ncbi:hypothetical protein [Mesorhizobium sp.]|uniref:hypothetical protein n=1 Tax=Mesorhizobium sp. TaxID=1871066 RepID=UPI0025BB71CE|nr:hypothetical protein [Mesorhizobium sp.]
MTAAIMATRPAMPLHTPVADRGGASEAINRSGFRSCSKAQPVVPLVPPDVLPLVPDVPLLLVSPDVPPDVPPLVPPDVLPLVPDVPLLLVSPDVPPDVPPLVPPDVLPLVPDVPLLPDPPLFLLAERCPASLPPANAHRPGNTQEASSTTGGPAAELINCRKSLATCAAAAQAPPATSADPTTNPTSRMNKPPATRATPGNARGSARDDQKTPAPAPGPDVFIPLAHGIRVLD